MCQYGGSLDYLIGLDVNSNEIRIIRMKYDSINLKTVIDNYKKVDRDEVTSQVRGEIYVDCAYQGVYLGVNSYVIGIGATVYKTQGSNTVTNYYLAKFSTKYNLTEYIADQSQMNIQQNSGIMEQAVGVKVDLANEMVYLAVEINKNIYNNRTVYAPGENPFPDNANIAILGFSWTHGVRLWTTVVGNGEYKDMFKVMNAMGNYLLVLLNSYSTQYSTNSSQTVTIIYSCNRISTTIECERRMGSSKDSGSLGLQRWTQPWTCR